MNFTTCICFVGEKHLKSVETYIPKELKIGSLEYLIGKHDSWVLGLANVEEYSLTPSEKSGCGNQTDKKKSPKVSYIDEFSQCAQRIFNRIEKPFNKTFTGLKHMPQVKCSEYILFEILD